MGYKQLPVEVCGPQRWPAGPFDPAEGSGDDDGLASAAATVGRLAAALTSRRQEYGWSRAMLARQSGIGPHAIGRIETGRTWPDLVTVARLAQALRLSLTVDGSSAGASAAARSAPAAGAESGATMLGVGQPLNLGSALSAAQVIEALFARDQRLAGEVAALRRNRLRHAQVEGGRGDGTGDQSVRVGVVTVAGTRR